jgi:phage-related minor tail protein
MGFAFQEMTDAIRDLIEVLGQLDDEVDNVSTVPTTGSSINANALGGVFSAGVKRFAKGGIVSNPSFFNMGLMGEAGPEAIMPLARVGGKLGVAARGVGGGGKVFVVNMDLRGAANGVGQEVERAMREFRRQVVDEAVSAVYRQRQLGGGFGDDF